MSNHVSVLGAEGAAFSVSDSIKSVTTQFAAGMKDVADAGLGLLGDAAPFIIAVVGAGVVLSFGVKWIKKIRG